jgi:hypothetical protein
MKKAGVVLVINRNTQGKKIVPRLLFATQDMPPSSAPATGNEVEENHDNGDDQQNMNESAHRGTGD